MKRLISLFTLLAMLLCLLSACSGKDTNKNDAMDTPNVEESAVHGLSRIEVDTDDLKRQAVAALNALPDTDISADGNLTVASTTALHYVPNADSSDYGNAMLERNKMFEKKYGVQLVELTELADDVMLDNAEKNYLSGLKYSDLLSIPASSVHRYIEKGLLLNVNSLPSTDFSAPYFNGAAMSSVTAGYRNYAIYGDFNKDLNNYYCVFVNHSLYAESGMELPYLSVENGDWTWDRMLEISRSFNTARPDLKAVTANSFSELTDTAFKSSGYDYFTTGYGITPSPSFASDGSQSLLETLRGMFGIYSAPANNAPSDFVDGNTLFCIGKAGDMDKVKTVGGDWGMLPLPKQFAGETDYTSYLTPDHAVICIFAGAESQNLFAAIEGLNAASTGEYMTEAYYNDLIVNSLPNSNTLNMLDYIFGRKKSRVVTDITHIYGTAYPELMTYTRDAIAETAKGTSVHIFAAQDSAAKNLENILKNFG